VLGKLYNLLAIVAIASMLAVGGFAAFLFGSGRLNADRAETIAAVLRGELDERAAEVSSTQPAQDDEAEASEAAPSAEEVHKALVGNKLRRAALERAARDVAARQELLDHALQDLLTRQENLEQERVALNERRQKELEALRDQGFQDELRVVGKLSPRQAKEHLVRAWKKHPADAVRLLRALDVSKSQRILEQLKTPEETEIMHELLEQLRLQEANELADRSGRTAGDARP
jgi:hypothetical protein